MPTFDSLASTQQPPQPHQTSSIPGYTTPDPLVTCAVVIICLWCHLSDTFVLPCVRMSRHSTPRHTFGARKPYCSCSRLKSASSCFCCHCCVAAIDSWTLSDGNAPSAAPCIPTMPSAALSWCNSSWLSISQSGIH